MKSIFDILSGKAPSSAFGRGVEAARVVEAANSILESLFGKEIKDCAQAIYFKNGTITVACLSSVAAQEIKICEEKIIFDLNAKFHKNIVNKINYSS